MTLRLKKELPIPYKNQSKISLIQTNAGQIILSGQQRITDTLRTIMVIITAGRTAIRRYTRDLDILPPGT